LPERRPHPYGHMPHHWLREMTGFFRWNELTFCAPARFRWNELTFCALAIVPFWCTQTLLTMFFARVAKCSATFL
jgi:hypothetical protein